MRLNYLLPLLFSAFFFSTYAQDDQTPSVNIGDIAPPLRVQEWLKGSPVKQFEKGKVYVVDFWATWCKYCIAGMPHLSALSRKYSNKVTFIGMDIYEHYESVHTSLPEVKRFVDSMGKRMNYNVAAEDSNFMETDWIFATGAKGEGIPRAFVIDEEGRLAWIGYPTLLDSVLPKVLNNTWNIKDALDKRIFDKSLAAMDVSFNYDLMKYGNDEYRGENFKIDGKQPNYIGKPDSALLLINKIVQDEPGLKYAPFIAFNTFSALLKTDLKKAYEYGKAAIVTPTYDDPAYDAVISGIQFYSDKLQFPASIYELGAEACQVKINNVVYPKLVRVYNYYHQMAAWYWLANEKSKAIHAERKAIKALKRRKNFSKTDLLVLKHQLKEYKRDTRG